MNGWNINAKGLEKKMGCRYNENRNIYFTIFLSVEERKVGMGKDLKGKELGKGISQRADGRYIARFTSKTGKRKTLYDFKLNELKRKLREAVYEDEHGLNGNGESITLNAWYVTWTELYKKKTVKMTTI